MNTPDPALQAKLPEALLPKLLEKFNSIKDALEKKDPMMSQHLRESHNLLNTYPETAQLLEDSEIKLLLQAAEEYTKKKIIEAATKSSSRGPRGKISASDL